MDYRLTPEDEAFREEFNYERQFAPVLAAVQALVSGP